MPTHLDFLPKFRGQVIMNLAVGTGAIEQNREHFGLNKLIERKHVACIVSGASDAARDIHWVKSLPTVLHFLADEGINRDEFIDGHASYLMAEMKKSIFFYSCQYKRHEYRNAD